MRFSPVLLAILTTSASVGWSSSLRAQTSSEVVALNHEAGQVRASSPEASFPETVLQAGATVLLPIHSPTQQRDAEGVEATFNQIAVSSPENFPTAALAQSSASTLTAQAAPPNQPGSPPPGTQTPVEGTPNQLQLRPRPQPSQVEIEPPQPLTQPAPQQPSVESPEQAPAEQAPAGQPPAGQTPAEQAPAGQTPVEQTPAEQAPTGQPPTGQPLDQPLFQPPATTTPATPTTPAEPQTQEPEPRVLVAEVVVSGADDQLQSIVYNAIRTQPGRTTTRSQLQEDSNRVFATGFFSSVRTVPEDTPLGVRVTFVVEPNPVLTGVRVQGAQVLTQQVVDDIFQPQVGRVLNFREFQQGVEEVNRWYQENGYVLAQIVSGPQVSPEGVATVEVAEGIIEDIQIRFLTAEGEATDEEGNPVQGRTRDFIVLREFELEPGEVFNQNQVQADLQRVFGLGIFEDARISLNPGTDPRQVDVIVNVTERNTGSLAAGLGISSASGLFGTASFQEQNLGGNNQRLGAEVQIGQRDLLFDISFTDPWIGGDPFRTSYTVNAFSRRSISLIFDGGEEEVTLPNGDRPRVERLGGGVNFGRPLGNGWRASVGLQYQHVSLADSDGDLSPVDEFGNDLSFSGTGEDDLFLVQLGAVNDQRNNALTPTSGSLLRLSTDQSVPIGAGSILLTRLRGSYSYYIPVRFTNFNEGPQALAFNVQAGTIFGDLPPYEAFSLGGTDSVRGYEAGELGSGRSFLIATAEYRFPIFAIIGGALFADFGTDFGTADDVPGAPAEIREKPGTGFGVGAGVRIQSPVGVIRIDFAVNDDGDNQIHFGIGERF